MKHTPKVFSGGALANRIIASEQIEDHDFSMVVTDDGEAVDGIEELFFVVQWPDCCTTEQHLGDATISDGYGTAAEALSAYPNAELY